MHLIDLHCDMIWKLCRDREQKKQGDIRNNEGAVSLLGLKKAGSMAQVFAAFIYMAKFKGSGRWTKGFEEAMHLLKDLDKEIEKTDGDIQWANDGKTLSDVIAQRKIAGIKSVEEGGILEGRIDRLEMLYQQGVRIVTLTWNEENCIGFPNSKDSKIMEKGLKEFGREVVSFMNRRGMLIDVSHLSDQGFYDIMELSEVPVLASHSNARSLCPHPRNLSDEMLRMLGNNGGVAGLNLYPYFVDEAGLSDMEKLTAHLKRMVSMAGEESVAIGTDFDGFDEGFSPITHIEQMPVFWEHLKKAGFTETILDKIWYKNAFRILKEGIK